MTQRGLPFSPAVASQRIEPADSLDFFPTPPWATRAFVKYVAVPVLGVRDDHDEFIWEPACGEGHMAEPLREAFRLVVASDIHPYGYDRVCDFLAEEDGKAADWIFTNPPFNQAVAFARKAIALSVRGVALLVRTQWLHTVERFKLFQDHPPFVIAYYVERVPMHRGRWEPGGDTATDYCWVCWKHGAEPRAPLWIPPGSRAAFSMLTDAARFAKPAAAPLIEPGA